MRSFVLILSLNLLVSALSLEALESARVINSYALHGEYTRAYSLLDTTVKQKDDLLFYGYLELSLIGLQSLDFMQCDSMVRYEQVVKKGEDYLAQFDEGSTLQKRTRALWLLSRASMEAFDGRYLRAYHKGSEALEVLAKLSHQSGTLQGDSWYYLGYENVMKHQIYRRSGKLLFWLKDSEESGSGYLDSSIVTAQFMGVAAQFSLIDNATLHADYTQAHRLIAELSDEFESSRYLLWARIRLSQAQKERENSACLFFELSQSYHLDGGNYASLYCADKSIDYFDTRVSSDFVLWWNKH